MLSEKFEDFLVAFEWRNQIRAGDSNAPRRARPFEHPPRHCKSVVARPVSRSFEPLKNCFWIERHADREVCRPAQILARPVGALIETREDSHKSDRIHFVHAARFRMIA